MSKNFIILIFASFTLFFLNGCEQKTQTKSEEINKTTEVTEELTETEELIAAGEVTSGAKLYREEMQKACNMSGYTLAKKKTKDEWKEIAQNGKFSYEIKKLCPNIEFKNIWTPDIYEYLHTNASSTKS